MNIIGFENSAELCQSLSEKLDIPYSLAKVHRFPDGESKVKITTDIEGTVIFVCSLDNPNHKLIELIFALETARKYGCKRAVLIAPYMCYMRQDCEFEPGQAVSQTIIGDFLSRSFDTIITIDPHLHRINRLDEAFTHSQAIALSATKAIGDHIKNNYNNAILVGPDEESEQWVSQVAQQCNFDFCVASKIRSGDKNVAVQLPNFDFANKTAILVDDVISSGHTIQQAALALTTAGCSEVFAACTHSLFAEGASDILKQAGVRKVLSCNTIKHPSNCIDISELLAHSLQKILQPS